MADDLTHAVQAGLDIFWKARDVFIDRLWKFRIHGVSMGDVGEDRIREIATVIPLESRPVPDMNRSGWLTSPHQDSVSSLGGERARTSWRILRPILVGVQAGQSR